MLLIFHISILFNFVWNFVVLNVGTMVSNIWVQASSSKAMLLGALFGPITRFRYPLPYYSRDPSKELSLVRAS